MASTIIVSTSVLTTVAIFYLTRNGDYNHSAGMFLAMTALFVVLSSIAYGLTQSCGFGC